MAEASSGAGGFLSTPACDASSRTPCTWATRVSSSADGQRVVDLQAAAEIEPLGDLLEVDVGEVAAKDVPDRRADDVARDVVGAPQLAFVLELELAGHGWQRRVDVGDARARWPARPRAIARRSALETTFSSSEIGRRWLTPDRLSIF